MVLGVQQRGGMGRASPSCVMVPDARTQNAIRYELIARRTSIPIPKIFGFSSGINNELGYLFTLMSRAKGIQLSKL